MSAALSIAETPDEKLERLRKDRAERNKGLRDAQIIRAITREELIARYEAELGIQGSEWDIVDSGHLDDPFVVVKRPALVQWTKYEQTKQTPTDRYDFVIPSVVYPSRDDYNALREKRIGVEVQASNAMAHMMGLVGDTDQGK